MMRLWPVHGPQPPSSDSSDSCAGVPSVFGALERGRQGCLSCNVCAERVLTPRLCAFALPQTIQKNWRGHRVRQDLSNFRAAAALNAAQSQGRSKDAPPSGSSARPRRRLHPKRSKFNSLNEALGGGGAPPPPPPPSEATDPRQRVGRRPPRPGASSSSSRGGGGGGSRPPPPPGGGGGRGRPPPPPPGANATGPAPPAASAGYTPPRRRVSRSKGGTRRTGRTAVGVPLQISSAVVKIQARAVQPYYNSTPA